MTQSNDLPARMNRAEDNIIDLRLAASALLQATEKNSADIATLIEVSRHLLEVSRRHSDDIGTIREGMVALQLAQLRTEAAIERLTASNERLEQLFEYLIRRDRGQLE